MSTVTTFLGLTKPAGIEQFNLATYNNNLDLIDAHANNAILKNRPFAHVGRTGGFNAASNTTVVNMDAAQVLIGGMTFDAAADTVTVPVAGRYRLSVRGYLSGGGTPTNVNARLQKNGGEISGTTVNGWKGDANDYVVFLSETVTLAAGDAIRCIVWGGSTQVTWGTDGYNGTWFEVEYVGG